MKKAENFIPFVSMVHENKGNGHQTAADAPARVFETCHKVYIPAEGIKRFQQGLLREGLRGFLTKNCSSSMSLTCTTKENWWWVLLTSDPLSASLRRLAGIWGRRNACLPSVSQTRVIREDYHLGWFDSCL